jgi:hypothetical protein
MPSPPQKADVTPALFTIMNFDDGLTPKFPRQPGRAYTILFVAKLPRPAIRQVRGEGFVSHEKADDATASGAEERLRQHLRARLPADEADALVEETIGAEQHEGSEQSDNAEPEAEANADHEEGGGHGQ